MSSLPLAGPGDARGADTAVGFGAFTLDLRAGQLRRAGTALSLRPTTWAVLLYLFQRAGSLVTKEELRDAIWPDVAVTPDTLNKSIGKLRSTLGDDIRQPRFIETVHRRGFRFLALPRAVADEDDAAPAGDGVGRPFLPRDAPGALRARPRRPPRRRRSPDR